MEPSAVIERLWPGGEAVFEPLGGGITNHNFKVVVDGQAFVLRIGGKDTELLGIDRQHEHEASLVAARAGVAPGVIRFLEPEGYLVTRFLRAYPIPPEELRRPENLERAAQLLRTFHDGEEISARFDSFRVVEDYRDEAARHGVEPPAAYAEAEELAGATAPRTGTRVFVQLSICSSSRASRRPRVNRRRSSPDSALTPAPCSASHDRRPRPRADRARDARGRRPSRGTARS